MIQNLMRKHKVAFLWGILILIIIPFVFWGGDFGSGNGGDARARLQTDPIAVVGGAPIAQAHFRMAVSNAIQQQRQNNPDISPRDLHENGVALEILESIVNDMILSQEANLAGYSFDREFLEDQLRKEPRFQEDGAFSPRLYNAWVEDNRAISWNAEYERIAHNEARRLVIEKIIASARVPEDEVRRQFEDMHTTVAVRYAAVAPAVEPTEAEINDFYTQNPARYENPEEMKAEYVAVSLAVPKPALVDELVTRARGGEDFAELAKTYSMGPFKDKGGDMDWQARTLSTQAHMLPAFDLAVGEVSDALEGPGGYYIYKLDEERTSAITGERDVRLRQIFIIPELPDDEKAKRIGQAKVIADKARETGDLAAAAVEAGLAVQQTGFFSSMSGSVENMPADDAWQFSAGVAKLALNEVSEPVECRNNVYVARVIEVKPATSQPLAEVYDRVKADAAMNIRRSEPYFRQVSEMSQTIEEKATRLEDIATLFPELTVDIQAATPFTIADFKMQSAPYWRPQDVFELAREAGPGKVAGPIIDMMGTTYFIELVSLTAPEQQVWDEKFEEERERIQSMLLQEAQRERLDDYFRERRMALNWQYDKDVYEEVLGLNQEEDADTEDATEEVVEEAGEEVPADSDAVSEAPEAAETVVEAEPVETAPEAPAEEAPAQP